MHARGVGADKRNGIVGKARADTYHAHQPRRPRAAAPRPTRGERDWSTDPSRGSSRRGAARLCLRASQLPRHSGRARGRERTAATGLPAHARTPSASRAPSTGPPWCREHGAVERDIEATAPAIPQSRQREARGHGDDAGAKRPARSPTSRPPRRSRATARPTKVPRTGSAGLGSCRVNVSPLSRSSCGSVDIPTLRRRGRPAPPRDGLADRNERDAEEESRDKSPGCRRNSRVAAGARSDRDRCIELVATLGQLQ